MPYIKEVLIDVITDVSPSESSSTTDHALEDGEQISDHVKSDPITLSISGVLYGDVEQKALKLREYREKGVLIAFDYMTNYGNMLIVDFKRDYKVDIKNGAAFTMTLKQVKLVKVAKTVSVKIPVKRQTKKVTSKGKKQIQKKPKAAAKTTKTKYKTPKQLGQANLERSKYLSSPYLKQAGLDISRSNNFGLGPSNLGQAGLGGRR
ncbi:phage baseplate protein [Solibacillus isronensis]|uniref:phage baseplate protein n=1 Tax=Solibacillus isronensis TaxID=412383 RepID=UPI0039A01656